MPPRKITMPRHASDDACQSSYLVRLEMRQLLIVFYVLFAFDANILLFCVHRTASNWTSSIADHAAIAIFVSGALIILSRVKPRVRRDWATLREPLCQPSTRSSRIQSIATDTCTIALWLGFVGCSIYSAVPVDPLTHG